MKGYLKSVSGTFDRKSDYSDVVEWVLSHIETSAPIDPSEEEHKTIKRYRIQISEVEELNYQASKIVKQANMKRARAKLAEQRKTA